MRQPDDHSEKGHLIFLLERDLKTACDALKNIQTAKADEASGIAFRARKAINWGGK